MTQLCVPIFVESIEQAKEAIARAKAAGAEMVELRVDEIDDTEQLDALLKAIPLPAIVTKRPTWEGGRCELEESARLAILGRIIRKGGYHVDIEWKSTANQKDWDLQPRQNRSGVIVSSHDFTGRPENLTRIYADMSASDADVAKIVWTARSIRDNLEAFEILRTRAKPTIAICMGEAGILSRILAKKFGAFLTFASLTKDTGTAPGQVTISDLKSIYRWDKQNEKTKVFGVIGSPIMHSMSPAIHNAAFDEINYDGVYVPLLVEPGYESFKAFMETFLHAEGLDLTGLSVTIPHKENALKYLKEKGAEIEELAIRIGAVNTIAIDRSAVQSGGAIKLKGINTDYAAILDSITNALGIEREDLAGKRVAVIGAGGTGRTAVACLAHYGATVVVYNRTKERADELAAEFNGKSGKVVSARLEKLCDSCCEIYINTTSVGMYPKVDESPLGENPPAFSSDTLVFDTIYNPIETKLLKHAREQGAKTVAGIEMFVRQAVGQFELWTGHQAPADTMRRVIESRLSGK